MNVELASANALQEEISVARDAIRGGCAEAALTIAEKLIAAAPLNIDVLEIKAIAEIMLGRHACAERTLRSAIAIAPERRWPYGDLSRLLDELGRNQEAEDVTRAALKADPNNPDAHAILGALLGKREHWADAENHFRRAAELTGAHPQLLAGLGQALLRQGRLNEAKTQLKSAIEADPNALEPNVHLAEVEERLGRFNEASAQLDQAERIARASGTDVDMQRSVLLSRLGRNEEALALLNGRTDLSGAALLQRGRLRDRLGRYEEAWCDWAAGKAQLAAKRNHRYDPRALEDQAHALASFFSSETFAALPRAALRTDLPQPIFIIGFPRSGTTLLEQILASHSLIAAGGELPLGGELRELAGKLAGGETAFPGGLKHITDPRWPDRLRDHYLKRIEQFGLLGGGAAYFTDKMPVNDMRLPLLKLAFPRSPVILVRRHPLDVLTSVMSHDMTHGSYCTYRLEDAARHLALVDRVTAQFAANGIGATYEIRYESLVADQAGETVRLMDAIALPMEEAQLRFDQRGSVSPTPSYAQVQEPMNDRSINRWRNYACELEIAREVVADAATRGNYTF